MSAPSVTLGAAARRLDARLGGLARWALPAAVAVPLCIVAAIATGIHSGFPTNWVIGVPYFSAMYQKLRRVLAMFWSNPFSCG